MMNIAEGLLDHFDAASQFDYVREQVQSIIGSLLSRFKR